MTDFAPLRFSTHALPVRERLPFWRDVFARKVARVDLEPLSDDQFEVEATLRAMPGLRAMTCNGSAACFRRTPEFVADGDDAVAILMNLGGTMCVSHRHRATPLDSGEAISILNSAPAVMEHSRSNFLTVVVPRATLSPLIASVEDAAMRVIPRGNDALRLLAGYLKMVHEGLPLATLELRHRVATHVHDLVAMAIGTTRDGGAIAETRGMRAARLAAIKADVIAHAGNPDLTLTAAAARQRVTPRYVQMLFESEGATFSQFVLEQRPTRAYQLLTSSRHVGSTISAIALAAGFGDLSHFNRSFRRRYGATPSDVRCASHSP